MKTKNIFLAIALSLGMLILFMIPASNEVGTAHAQGPDVGAQDADTQLVVNIPSVPATGTVPSINVNVGDTVNIPVQVGTVAGADNFNSVTLSFQLPANNIIQVIDVTPVANAYSNVIAAQNIAPNNSVAFTVNFLPPFPGVAGTALTTIANIRVRALKTAAGAQLTFNTTSEARYTTPGGAATGAGAILVTNFGYNCTSIAVALAAANCPAATSLFAVAIPINILYPQMNMFIDNTTPPNYNISVGQTQNTQVRLNQIVGVRRIRFQLNPQTAATLNAVTPDNLFTLTSFDRTTGIVELTSQNGVAVSVLNPQTVATLTWQGTTPGTAAQTFSMVELYDADNTLITNRLLTSQNGGNITVSAQQISLRLNPSTLTIPLVGNTATQVVTTTGVFNLRDVRFRLTFDQSVVQVDSVQPGSLYTGATVITTGNSIDFTYNGTARINTNSEVLRITWRAVGAGQSKDISFSQSDLVLNDDAGNVIGNVTGQRGSVTVSGDNSTATPTSTISSTTPTPTGIATLTPTGTVTPTPTNTPTPTGTTTPTATPTPTMTPVTTPTTTNISGRVRLQGRATNAGAKVYAENVPCTSFISNAGNQMATTDADGKFQFNTNGKNYQCLQVVKEGHLTAQKSAGVVSGDLGWIEMPGGNFTDSGTPNIINIFDLSYAGGKYGKTDSLADFNADGKVDILDLAIVAGNYMLTGPMSEWR